MNDIDSVEWQEPLLRKLGILPEQGSDRQPKSKYYLDFLKSGRDALSQETQFKIWFAVGIFCQIGLNADDERPLLNLERLNLTIVPKILADLAIIMGFLVILGFSKGVIPVYYGCALYNGFIYLFKRNLYTHNLLPYYMPIFILVWHRGSTFCSVFLRLTAIVLIGTYMIIGILTLGTNSNPI